MNTHTLFLLTSPPASGKTFWIHSLMKQFPEEKILLISPLRALRDECANRWGESILVMTPEEWLGKKVFSRLVIFDEFHLLYYWGNTFRPAMWEVFYEINEKAQICFGLTATLSQEMSEEVKGLSAHFDEILWMNFGNQQLKNKPIRYLKVSNKSWILRKALDEKRGKSVKLFFCQYRYEVLEIANKMESAGFSCLTCVGGESKFMAQKLSDTPKPDFIVSTTVLSHGVNLPEITKIYFNYKVSQQDFWIQMVARGGRRGESFEVIAMDRPWGLNWSRWKNSLHLFWLSLKLNFSFRSLNIFLN